MRTYRRTYKALPVLRSIAVLSAVGIVSTVVSFAAIQSTGTALTGNTIETATASLQISTDGKTFTDSVPGFDFNSIIPGGSAVPYGGYMVELKNTGSTGLNLWLSVPTAPTMTGVSDPSMVNVLLTHPPQTGFSYTPQTFKLSDLTSSEVALTGADATVAVGQTVTFELQVSMGADAVDGASASITGLDLSFSGTPQ